MIPIQRSCDCENLSDFVRYYQNSWVGWHPDKDEINPQYVGGLIDNNHALIRPLLRDEGMIVVGPNRPVSWKELNERIDFGMPDIGMIPEGPTFIYGSYTTPRVAKKGFRTRELRTQGFNTWDIRKKYVPSPIERYENVWFAFNPTYCTLQEAEAKLMAGTFVGVPISRTLGVFSMPRFKHSLLAYKRWTIGHVLSPNLIQLKREYGDYEEDVAKQTGAAVIVG